MLKDKLLRQSKGILNTRILRSKLNERQVRKLLGGMWFRVSVLLILIAIIVRSFFWQPFAIPSQSMLPTVMAGDYIFADKSVYGYNRHTLPFSPGWFSNSMKESAIKRGDVIVFRGKDNRDYIKRIIGMPGDRLQMVAGALHIDGLAVKKQRVTDMIIAESDNSPCLLASETREKTGKLGAICRYPQYKETLPGDISYMTLDLSTTSLYDTSKLVMVPPGQYYVMGDNRDFSLDSRDSGQDGVPDLVALDHIIGKADTVVLSSDGSDAWLDALRGDRYLKPLNE